MADVKLAVTRFSLATTGTTQSVAAPAGFGTPKAAIFIRQQSNTNDTPLGALSWSIGFTDGVDQAADGSYSRDNNDISVTSRAESASVIVAPTSQGSGLSVEVEFSRWLVPGTDGSDGALLTLTNPPGSECLVTCIFIGGTDVLSAKAAFDNLGTGATKTVTTGFEPTVLFAANSAFSSPPTVFNTHQFTNIGVAANTAGLPQRVSCSVSRTSQAATNAKAALYSGSLLACIEQEFSTQKFEAEVTAYSATGFTLTPSGDSDNRYFAYLALEFASDVDVAIFDMEWPAAGDYIESGAGFEPDFGFIASMYGLTARDAITETTDIYSQSLSFFNATDINTISAQENNLAGTVDTATASSNSLRLLDNVSALSAAASAYSFDSGGWTFTMSTSPSVPTLGFGLAIGSGSVPPSGSIALTDLTDNRIFQRVVATNNYAVPVSGTYTGTPTSIEARVVQAGTSTVVVDWTTVEPSPAAGVFSGSLTVPAGAVMYSLQVRFGNDGAVTSNGTSQWGIGALFATAGQSQLERWVTDASGTPLTPYSTSKVYNASGWGALTQGGAQGDGAISFCDTYTDYFGVACGLLDYAIGSTALLQAADDGAGYWLDTSAAEPYQLLVDGVNDNDGAVEGILWAQGGRDAQAGVSPVDYKAGLVTLFGRFRTDIANASVLGEIPIFTVPLGISTAGYNDEDWNGIRQATVEAAGEISNTVVAAYMLDLPLSDTVHLTPPGYSVMAQRVALAVEDILGDGTYHLGPAISGVAMHSGTQIDVTLAPQNGTDFTPSTGITGFEVSEDDFASTVGISSAARLDATTVRLTLAAPVSSARVRYQYGAAPDVTGAVLDNNAPLNLPLAFTATILPAAVSLSPVDISQSQVLDEALLSQQGSITAATVTQSQILEQAALAQHYQEIQIADLSQAQAIEAAILIQEGGITARVISQSQTLEQAILAISGIVVNDISQGQAIEQALMLQTGTIAVHNLTQSQSIDATSLSQTYVLPIVDISQGQSLGTVDLQVDTTTLQPVSVQQAVVLETPGLTQYAVITADSITQGQVVATCNVGDLTAGTLDGKYVLYASMDAEFIIH